ncbi:hypothetical protein KJS94_09675 [Flavihumibacter rivuli]|uniref:hypothetical protein n=1 Tax=Flavihumibacter rivuli TaxID=2838156 RepID=UPI001BDEC460|nr:hypothetical protein [Flavihumibacter rivuli]ULQ54906.1 hypothetical protein KJS94_09675 [Flavihumibacter rivuli]
MARLFKQIWLILLVLVFAGNLPVKAGNYVASFPDQQSCSIEPSTRDAEPSALPAITTVKAAVPLPGQEGLPFDIEEPRETEDEEEGNKKTLTGSSLSFAECYALLLQVINNPVHSVESGYAIPIHYTSPRRFLECRMIRI